MPLKVFCCCTYRTSGRDWTSREWAACWFIKALKNKPINGYARVPLPGGTSAFLDKSTAADAPKWFADMVAARIKWQRVGPVALVPIPNSGCVLNDGTVPRTLAMSVALADRLGGQAVVADVLRWIGCIPLLIKRAAREIQRLYTRLRLAGTPASDRRSILITTYWLLVVISRQQRHSWPTTESRSSARFAEGTPTMRFWATMRSG